MTIEIRELMVQVEVAQSLPRTPVPDNANLTGWDEQQLLEKLKQEVLESLLERGLL